MTFLLNVLLLKIQMEVYNQLIESKSTVNNYEEYHYDQAIVTR